MSKRPCCPEIEKILDSAFQDRHRYWVIRFAPWWACMESEHLKSEESIPYNTPLPDEDDTDPKKFSSNSDDTTTPGRDASMRSYFNTCRRTTSISGRSLTIDRSA
eukprot:TRINITY_DN13722_c0_g2_i1.p1 TRINITY_DN13722_c0_g2~~TRINITY_DN13722_c0_g2_i1.p1  ORF type:complete len:114 (-),score=9.97 TRINITY_DN13722_c0_g2_i1:11-325(-)